MKLDSFCGDGNFDGESCVSVDFEHVGNEGQRKENKDEHIGLGCMNTQRKRGGFERRGRRQKRGKVRKFISFARTNPTKHVVRDEGCPTNKETKNRGYRDNTCLHVEVSSPSYEASGGSLELQPQSLGQQGVLLGMVLVLLKWILVVSSVNPVEIF